MIMRLREKFLTTGIGSLPYIEARESSEKICAELDIPFWPQLPKRGFRESMYAQFAQGLPALIIDDNNRKIYVDTSKDLSEDLGKLYELYLSEDYDAIGITKDFAEGFYAFLEAAKEFKPSWVKGHITGPVSFGLGVTDEKGKAIIYNDSLKEALVKLLEMKAVWQIEKLKAVSKNIIIFIDEPYLTSFGSSYVNIERDDIILMLNAIIGKIHSKGAFSGIHCCGNTDWSLLTETEVDIINFDAYSYMDSFALYVNPINKFLKRGGYLAWGIVPTSEKASEESAQAIFERLSLNIETLAKKSVDRSSLITNSLLTPSCGMGTLSEVLAEDILGKLKAVSELAKREL